jgi:hypothetical protein
MKPTKVFFDRFLLSGVKFFLFCFLLFGFNNSGFGQQKKLQFLHKKDTVAKKEGFFLFPLLYYTPDTRIAAGLVGVYYFNTGKSDSLQKTRLSYTKLLGDYTQNKQLDFWTSWNVFTNEEKYLFKGEFRYRNFPDKFYGIGNSSNELNLEKYAYDLFKFKLLAMRQVARKLFVGIDYQYENEYNFILQTGGELEKGTITGYRGGVGSALGFVTTYDTRDNVVNAYSGHILEFSSYFNTRYLGGSFNYVNLNFEFGKYWEVRKNNVFAVNVIMNSNFGNVPFLDMAKVGGDGMIRGYASNRFRDHHFIGAQVEYRFPLWWRFGMVVFTGVGDVFNTPLDIKINTLKYTVGAGIRFAINSKERLNVRFDYGFGRKSNAFYIMLTEAF